MLKHCDHPVIAQTDWQTGPKKEYSVDESPMTAGKGTDCILQNILKVFCWLNWNNYFKGKKPISFEHQVIYLTLRVRARWGEGAHSTSSWTSDRGVPGPRETEKPLFKNMDGTLHCRPFIKEFIFLWKNDDFSITKISNKQLNSEKDFYTSSQNFCASSIASRILSVLISWLVFLVKYLLFILLH